jgi:hypothetical protein
VINEFMTWAVLHVREAAVTVGITAVVGFVWGMIGIIREMGDGV